MKINNNKLLVMVLVIIFVITFSACTGNTEDDEATIAMSGSLQLVQTALEVVNELNSMDMLNLSERIDPDRGLIIAPYSNIDLGNTNIFTKEEFAVLNDSPDQVTWGNFDGSGEPILLTFSEYYNLFIFDLDFTTPDIIGVNEIVGTGNTINNLNEAFPNSESVEFHITGIDPAYEGMDWRSLRLGFEMIDGEYYLVYIAHDQWTI